MRNKNGVAYTSCIHHTVKNSLNSFITEEIISYFLPAHYFSLLANRFLMVLTNSFETPR
jgi:hypothetical protein